MHDINTIEYRPFHYLDFLAFEANEKKYFVAHGTFRNKISRLTRTGVVKLVYNSKVAFYILTGINLAIIIR